jgi:hypothetical protein
MMGELINFVASRDFIRFVRPLLEWFPIGRRLARRHGDGLALLFNIGKFAIA